LGTDLLLSHSQAFYRRPVANLALAMEKALRLNCPTTDDKKRRRAPGCN